ncbi:PrsW family glutamic-type intramembrane protease [Paenibacillus spongiae]|uniref:PrsW family glutamic-type intramembrane protease n=1 Tax=Paenibacillus spongiae TaxID=2909671 RepID=A0ABY5S842_9BACL|nr:PrsW family glutamic-type intramembrane protease [Paenibacillus spongiae]UVI29750.1 PrsW family glutamic-type intramembrane protease [Paenibacillus spongiae]
MFRGSDQREEASVTSTIWQLRSGIRDMLEAAYRFILVLIKKYPFIRTTYTIFSWISLIVFIVSLFVVPDSRKMLVQYLWSFYVLIQFWVLCRSKTLPWKPVALFVLSGVLFVVPFTALTMNGLHAIFGGRTNDTWSVAVMTPIFEELWKLLPLGAFLLFSRRASALSLGDYALIGGATGVGFQLMEELSRRWVNSGGFSDKFGYSFTIFGGETIHWDFFSLFPGRFEESILPSMMTVGHPVITAMIALAIGIAHRLRPKLSMAVYLFPMIFLAWGILDHAAYNGQNRLPEWILTIHEWTGSGYRTRSAFLLMLAAAVSADYWALNKIRRKLPSLPGELPLNPFSELWNMTAALFRDRGRFVHWLGFYRERRELGFILLYGNSEAAGRGDPVRERMQAFYRIVAGLALLLLTAGLFAGMSVYAAGGQDSACFACLFDSLQNWWDRLEWYEQGAIVLGALALSLLFVGFWPALGIAMTVWGVAGSGHEIAGYIRDPKKLLTPENAAAVLVGIAISRIPFGRAFAWAGKKGAGYWRKLLDRIGFRKPGKPEVPVPVKPKPDVPGPDRTPDGPEKPDDKPNEKPNEKPGGDKPDHDKPDDDKPDEKPDGDRDDGTTAFDRSDYREVEIVDSKNSPIGEFDQVDMEKKIFYEDKSAEGLHRVNPKTGLPAQTPQEFADKQILGKTRTRIHNLMNNAATTRPKATGTPEVPTLDEIRTIRDFVFRLDGDTPALRTAVENSMNQLRTEFPDYTFNATFGGKP